MPSVRRCARRVLSGQGRRKKGKHKARELNQKDKEGTDMDAFVDTTQVGWL